MVITGLTRNQLNRKVPWVRIPPAPPEGSETNSLFLRYSAKWGVRLYNLLYFDVLIVYDDIADKGSKQNALILIRIFYLLVPCTVIPVTGKTVQLIHQNDFKVHFSLILNHHLELRSFIGSTCQGSVRIDVDNRKVMLLCILFADTNLTFY